MNMSRILLPLAVALPMLLAGAAADAKTRYLSEVDDLPLAPGLVEQAGGTLFDTPQGRIVETVAQGSATEPAAGAQVRLFYDKVLPQLGWAKNGNDSYVREREFLKIDIEDSANTVVVHYSITPRTRPGTTANEGKNQ